MSCERELCDTLIQCFQTTFTASSQTILVGGFSEPFYKAPTVSEQGEIQFSHHYPRSACHEIAHWLVAGSKRRSLDDYGYWYAPDGRDRVQQEAFYRVEVLPQAYEWMMCERIGLAFEVSADNLEGVQTGLLLFKSKVEHQVTELKNHQRDWPHRLKAWLSALEDEFQPSSVATLPAIV